MKPNYFKIGLYIAGTIAVFVAIYMIYRAFTRAKAGVASIGDAIQDTRTNNEIATVTGVNVLDVDKARKIAYDISIELETNKSLTSWNNLKHFVTDAKIIDIMSQVKSANMIRTVGHIYQNEMTTNHNLRTDLENELSNSNFTKKIPFVEALK